MKFTVQQHTTRTSITIFILVILSLIKISLNSALAVNNGAKLYQNYCAACHGQQGNGGVGVPLKLQSFQNSVSNQYLFKTIRYGRPERVMPAFNHLSDAQIKSIVKTIRQFNKTKINITKANYKTINGNAKLGKKIFKIHCASCHGDQGKGGKGTGVTFSRPRNLAIIAPALNNKGFLKSASDQLIKHTTLNGRKGTPMPAFKKKLKNNEINALVAYIRHFEKQKISTKEKSTKQSAIIKVKSNYSLKETVENLKRAVKGANFRLIRVQYLNQGLVKKGKENKKQVIIYFCNFRQLNTALAIDPRVGMFLPCRLTVVEINKEVFFIGINPSRLSSLFNNNELDNVCGSMKKLYLSIIEEANL